MIASITGADLVLIVTEPTLSGKHDLQRVAELAANFKIPALVCINKADINPKITREIESEVNLHGLKMAGTIRYDEAFTRAQIAESTVIEFTNGATSEEIKSLWQNVTNALN